MLFKWVNTSFHSSTGQNLVKMSEGYLSYFPFTYYLPHSMGSLAPLPYLNPSFNPSLLTSLYNVPGYTGLGTPYSKPESKGYVAVETHHTKMCTL